MASTYSKRMHDLICGEMAMHFERVLGFKCGSQGGTDFTKRAVAYTNRVCNIPGTYRRDFVLFLKFNYPYIYTEWIDQVGKAVASNVMKAGAMVRQKARQSIRRVKGEVYSKPGQPPKTRSGRLKDTIRFAEDTRTGNVLVGPVGGASNVPHILEYGGTASSSKSLRHAVYRVGDWGPVALQPGDRKWKSAQLVRGYDNSGQLTRIWAVRRKLVSPAQATRANRIQNEELLKGRFADETYELAPRPYMHPAMENAKGDIVAKWAGSL